MDKYSENKQNEITTLVDLLQVFRDNFPVFLGRLAEISGGVLPSLSEPHCLEDGTKWAVYGMTSKAMFVLINDEVHTKSYNS